MFKYNYNHPNKADWPNKDPLFIVAADRGNAITESYYWSLVGQINNGETYKAVCRIEHLPTGSFSFHLISI